MNLRILIHLLGALAGALAAQTVVFQEFSAAANHDIVVVAGLVVVVVNAWLALTSTGQAKNSQ